MGGGKRREVAAGTEESRNSDGREAVEFDADKIGRAGLDSGLGLGSSWAGREAYEAALERVERAA
jgi:hypothetical protein